VSAISLPADVADKADFAVSGSPFGSCHLFILHKIAIGQHALRVELRDWARIQNLVLTYRDETGATAQETYVVGGRCENGLGNMG